MPKYCFIETTSGDVYELPWFEDGVLVPYGIKFEQKLKEWMNLPKEHNQVIGTGYGIRFSTSEIRYGWIEEIPDE